MQESAGISESDLRCAGCGYDLSGSMVGGRCPECGTAVAESIRARDFGARSCGMATASLVVGIISVALCGLAGPVAMYLAHRARREMRIGGYARASHTMARAGMITGAIATVLTILWLFVVIGDEIF